MTVNEDRFMNEMRGLFKDSKITPNSHIDDLIEKGRFDSMDRSEVAMHIEEAFGVDIWGTDLRTFDTFQDLMNYAYLQQEKKAE